MATEAWDSSLPAALRERFGDSVRQVVHYGGQKLVVNGLGAVADILASTYSYQIYGGLRPAPRIVRLWLLAATLSLAAPT